MIPLIEAGVGTLELQAKFPAHKAELEIQRQMSSIQYIFTTCTERKILDKIQQ